jgi:hypothetical protein
MSAHTEVPRQGVLEPGRNQLTIIALLIVLIYASASTVIGFSQRIDPSQKWPLVWFLVLFPLLVLGIFGWLVSRHHGKPYVTAAGELGNSEMFLSTLTADQQRRKLTRDIASFTLVAEDALTPDLNGLDSSGEMHAPLTGQDPRAMYMVAEDLVLRKLEIDRGPGFVRHVTLEGVPFDAVIVRGDKVVAVEVELMTTPRIKQDLVAALLDNAEYAATRLKRTYPGAGFTFLLAIATQMPEAEQAKLRSNLLNKFGVTPVDIDMEFFDFDQLQFEFASWNADD